MKTSDSIIKIAPALLTAQKNIENAVKSAENPFFHSSYADLGSVMNACKEVLNKNGIMVVQPINGMALETILIHESGEWMASETPIVCKVQNDPQALGSAITYARRYGLQSMVFISAEDDDAESATNHVKTTVKAKTTEKDPTEEWTMDKTEDIDPFCTVCDKPVTLKVATYSKERYGKVLCFEHQKEVKTT